MTKASRSLAALLALITLVALGGCGGEEGAETARASVLPGGSWDATLDAARGQTVRLAAVARTLRT